jgi:nucleoside-diphosphate-sugar epimerase
MCAKNKPTIAITGATGFLGSHLAASLLEKGYRVIILGRPANGETLRERVLKLLRWFGLENRSDQVEMVEIDFTGDRCGIQTSKYTELCAAIDQVIHCASDTSFSERKREQVLETNTRHLTGILELASDARVNFFHYISTAYAAGVTDTVCKEQLSTTTDFVNVYEESKAQAEKVIAAYCEKHLLPLNIIRPPIVYGDSRTGRSLKFNALYYPIRSLQNIRDIYLNDIAHHGGQKSQVHGIYLDDEGFLFLPLRIYLPKKGSLNLIPVDYFVNATLKIIEKDLSGGIYHLTSKTPTTLETIAVYNERFMKVKGIEIIYSEGGNHIMRNPAEELFGRFIGPYRPYLSDARVFERTNSDRVTGDLQPPEFSAEIFNRCMEFAVRAQWGENLYGD